MPKLSERGFIAHLLLIIILALGLIVAVYLIQKGPLNFLPKASVSKPNGPETSFTLIGSNDCPAGLMCLLQYFLPPQKGEEFEVRLYARSDIETANLFTAKMTFPKDLVEVKEIKTDGSFVKNWVENHHDNNEGTISLVGGMPAPGYQTQVGGESVLMATIVFRAKELGKGTVVLTDASEILSNLNNINILTIKRSYDFTVEVQPSMPPVSGPVSSCNYNSTQARVQRDLSDPWDSSKTINVGDKIRVGGFHNETGLLASDVNLKVTGPKDCSVDSNVCTQASMNPANGDFIAPPSVPGAYTLTVTTNGQSGSACEDSATFEVRKCVVRPACLDAFPACEMSEPIEGWCSSSEQQKGDGNKDGKINLVDMSIVHTDWMKVKGKSTNFRDGIDMNSDGIINTFDYSLLRNKLLELGVIK